MTDTAPTVLFVCASTAGKSVMAQHLMRHTVPAQITATSVGIHAKPPSTTSPRKSWSNWPWTSPSPATQLTDPHRGS